MRLHWKWHRSLPSSLKLWLDGKFDNTVCHAIYFMHSLGLYWCTNDRGHGMTFYLNAYIHDLTLSVMRKMMVKLHNNLS